MDLHMLDIFHTNYLGEISFSILSLRFFKNTCNFHSCHPERDNGFHMNFNRFSERFFLKCLRFCTWMQKCICPKLKLHMLSHYVPYSHITLAPIINVHMHNIMYNMIFLYSSVLSNNIWKQRFACPQMKNNALFI